MVYYKFTYTFKQKMPQLKGSHWVLYLIGELLIYQCHCYHCVDGHFLFWKTFCKADSQLRQYHFRNYITYFKAANAPRVDSYRIQIIQHLLFQVQSLCVYQKDNHQQTYNRYPVDIMLLKCLIIASYKW